MTWAAIAVGGIGAGASLIGGALAPGAPEQQRRYPELKKNPEMALAMMRKMMSQPKFDYGALRQRSAAPASPGVPDYAATLAAARQGGR